MLCSWEPIIQSFIDVNKDLPSLFSKNKPEARAIAGGRGGDPKQSRGFSRERGPFSPHRRV